MVKWDIFDVSNLCVYLRERELNKGCCSQRMTTTKPQHTELCYPLTLWSKSVA